MKYIGFSAILSGVDLNVDSMTYCLLHRNAKDSHEPGQTRLLATDRVAAKDNLLTPVEN